MRGLLLRVSQLDGDAANALLVIGFFDQLLPGPANLDTVLRQAAALAECAVGISSPDRSISLQAAPGAVPAPCPGVPAGAARQELKGDTTVWLARPGRPAPLDDMILERFAITVATHLNHASLPRPQLGDPALVELVLSPNTGTEDRTRALRLLGFDPAAKLRVLAATDATAVRGHTARLGRDWAALCTGPAPDSAPNGARLGVGPRLPAIEASRSWRSAGRALLFTTTRRPVVDWAGLGCFVLLADLFERGEFDHRDLTALDRLAAEPGGGHLLATLDTFCATGSARRSAEELHCHHSTIDKRLARAAAALGFRLDSPIGQHRLHLALTFRTIRDNSTGR